MKSASRRCILIAMAGAASTVDRLGGGGLRVALRLAFFTALGSATGFLSGWCWSGEIGGQFALVGWAPGVIYGILWLVAGWNGKAMVVRPGYPRSWRWALVFLAGVALSYKAAEQSAEHMASFLTDSHSIDLKAHHLAISGFLGGIPGGLGLACMLGLLFRGFDSWGTRTVLTVCGAVLGSALVLWQHDLGIVDDADRNEPTYGLILFFITWQGGMAAAIVAMDAVWRSKPAD